MLFFADMLLLAAVFALAAAIAEIEVYSMGVHIGSGIAVMFGSCLLISPLEMLLTDVRVGSPAHRSSLPVVAVLISACVAWLLAQLFARWFYSADTRQANVMALTVGIGQALILLFWRWAVS